MSGVFQRFKGAFKRNRRVQQSPAKINTNRPANRERGFDRITTPLQPLENDNIIEDDIDSFQDGNGSERSQLAEQPIRPKPFRARSPSVASDRPLNNYRPSSDHSPFTTPLPTNISRNVNSLVDTNTAPAASVPNRIELPVPPPPPLNTNSSRPPVNPIPQLTVRPITAHLLTRNRRPFQPSPNSNLIGFPTHQTSRWQPPRNAFSSSFFPAQRNSPNFEFDYPIENVFADDHISPSLAIKINEAINYDRFGRAYYTHHYAYEPTTQHIRIGNKQHMQRRLVENTSHRGRRYIREVIDENSFPVQEHFSTDQRVLVETISPVSYQVFPSCDLNLFPPPVKHFSAFATPNDPMRLW